MGKRLKKQYPENFRTLAGFSGAVFTNSLGCTILGVFMLFLTDYSGIDSLIGKAGFAATFATVFLLITRIIDAIDDPLQGWLMDSGKEIKFGKYRRFGIIGTVLITAGMIMLFSMPSSVKSSATLLWIWCIVGYIVMEMGCAMAVTGPILQKATTDAKVRAKILAVSRFAIVIAAIPATFFVPLVVAVAGEGGDLSSAATTVAVAFAIVFAVITLIGFALLKEPYRPQTNEEKTRKLSLKEIWNMLKGNKAIWAHNISWFIGNMSYGISAAVMAYFLKWYFCADLATGAVDQVMFASLSGIYGIVTLLPNFLAPFMVTPVMKLAKSPDRGMRMCMIMIAICYALIFILAITGILRAMPIVFFVLYFLVMMPSGVSSVFAGLLNIDVADYAEFTTGKNMTAITNSVYNVVCKAQNAIGGVVPGVLLIMVGYSVDATTGAFSGNLSALPGMVNGLAVVAALIPAVLAIICALIYRKFYKITPELRANMTSELTNRRTDRVAE